MKNRPADNYNPTQYRIVEAALRVFAEHGFHEATYSQITKEAGVARGLAHYYFPSKEELLVAILDEAQYRLWEMFEKLKQIKSPRKRLRVFLEHNFQLLREEADFFILMYRLALLKELPPAARERFETIYTDSIEFTSVLLYENKFPNPIENAQLLIAQLDGIGIDYLFLKEKFPLETMEKMLIRQYMDLVKKYKQKYQARQRAKRKTEQ